MNKKRLLICFALSLSLNVFAQYPSSWWKPIPRDQAQSWEILPQDAGPGEVILSKRNELGVFSNLGAAEFHFDGRNYGSVEGLWQLMKYPDPLINDDPRGKLSYPYNRDEVAKMSLWESKTAGDLANEIMEQNQINFVSYKGTKFWYKDMGEGSAFHYKLISSAICEKVIQNEEIKSLLLKTSGLRLMPDHKIRPSKPKSYFYNEILMKVRSHLERDINYSCPELL